MVFSSLVTNRSYFRDKRVASEKDKPDKALSPLKQVLKKEVEPTCKGGKVRVNPSRCSASMSQKREREREREEETESEEDYYEA